jgi:endonuclease/exonuclease/phosphatase family metal-dependent hydrolase
VALVVRTWNLFHGNTVPPGRRAYLREMVELVVRGADIVCLQELPVWSLDRLERWSGMRAVTAIARSPLLGGAGIGRAMTEVHHGLLRSAFTGEADAILVDRRFELDRMRTAVVSDDGLRRIAHGVRLDGEVDVVNFHISADPEQLRRAAELVGPEPKAILAGDANLVAAPVAGFSEPFAGSIDQILVRGLEVRDALVWPEEARRSGRRLLSDHAPVELTVE